MPFRPWLGAALALCACKARAPVPFDVPASPWATAQALPAPRFAPAVTAMGEQVIAVGGWTGSGSAAALTADASIFDVPSAAWTALPAAPSARQYGQLGAIASTVFALGGLDASGSAQGDAYSLETTAETIGSDVWKTLAPLPAGYERGAAAVVVTAPRIYLIGGERDGAPLASIIYYDAIEDAWCPGSACDQVGDMLPDLPAALVAPAAARRSDGTFVVTGGLTALGSAAAAAGATYILSPDEQNGSGTWAMGSAMPHPRGDCAYGTIETRLVCAGGEDATGAVTFTEGYDLINDDWIEYPSMPVARTGTPGAAVADQLYVPGGAADTGDAPTDTVYVFTLNDVDTGSAQ